MEEIFGPNNMLSWLLFGFCAFLMGLSKTGIPNVGTLTIPILAFLFGPKESTGVILPLLCMADGVAIAYYKRKFNIRPIVPLIPRALLGLVLALILGQYLDSLAFGKWMGGILLGSVLWLLWSQYRPTKDSFMHQKWIQGLFGLLIGFTSMLGNAAGPVVALYLLRSQLPKFEFVACSVWLLMVLNLIKLPLQWLVWDNIHVQHLHLAAYFFPVVVLGGCCGIWFLRKIDDQRFRLITLWLIIIASLFLLWNAPQEPPTLA